MEGRDGSSEAILVAIASLKAMLSTAKQDFSDDPVAFTNSKIFKMARYINVMSELLVNLDQAFADNDALESALSDQGIQMDESLADFKNAWNEFLTKVEDSSFQVGFNYIRDSLRLYLIIV